MKAIETLIVGKYSVVKDVSFEKGHRIFQVSVEDGLIEVYLFNLQLIIERP